MLGSVSLDWALERHQSATDSNNADDENISDHGRARRLLYARRFDSTDTSLQVMGFRYQSKDFMDFPDYASWRWGDIYIRIVSVSRKLSPISELSLSSTG